MSDYDGVRFRVVFSWPNGDSSYVDFVGPDAEHDAVKYHRAITTEFPDAIIERRDSWQVWRP